LIFYRDNAKSLSAVIGTMGGPPMALDNDLHPASRTFVTANYFSELAEPVALGRTLQAGTDDIPNAPPVVVLSYDFWQARFGGDPSVIGRTIRLNKKSATVVGVLPRGFAHLGEANSDVWLPISQQPWFYEGSKALTSSTVDQGTVRMWGRLAAGATPQQAEQELRVLTDELRRQHPQDIWDGEFLKIDPAGHSVVADKDIYFVVTIVGTLVLLILAVACANLSGLLLARGISREREIGIRTAVGASAMRIFRQLFTESLVLAFVGAVAGQTLSYIILRILLTRLNAPGWMNATPDWRVLLFAVGISLATAVLFGLAPASQIARQKQRKSVARQILIGAQIAGSCVLLIVGGLLVRAVEHTLHTNPGFGYEQVVLVDLNLKDHGYSDPNARDLLEQLTARLQATPGVVAVGLSSMPPLGHGRIATIGTEIAGRQVEVYPFQVDPAFFKTMSVALLRGRNFLPGEMNAIIVSDSFARMQWPGQDPIGQLLPNGAAKDTVIGVAHSARMIALNDGEALETYHAAQLSDMPNVVVLIRTAGAPESLPAAVKGIVEQLDPKLSPDIRILKSTFKQQMSGVQQAATMVSLLGIAAILLAGIGVVGLVAYAVSQRVKEIAIRTALGANHAQVLAAVLQQFMWPMILGTLAGSLGAVALASFMTKALYGLSFLDPASYFGAIAILAVIIAIAMLLPARRALGLDIAKTLRYE
jgi:predicted permease